MSKLEVAIFVVLFLCAMGFFLRNVYLLFAMVCLGRWENRFDHLLSRMGSMLFYAFGQRRVVSEKFGINHFVIFWGFLALLLINAEFLVGGIFPSFSFAFLGTTIYGVVLLVANFVSAVVLAAVVVAAVRRLFFRPAHIEASFDAFIILFLIAGLMIAYYGLDACEIQMGHAEMKNWTPISVAFSGLLADSSQAYVHTLSRVFWWSHAIILLFFMNYLPYGKHLHILTAIPNCFFKSTSFVNTVPQMEFKKGNNFGISKVVQFTWKGLFDFLSCTECGRCQAACPAHNTDKPLNPKEIIHQGKMNLFVNGKTILASRPCDTLAAAGDDASMAVPLISRESKLDDQVGVDAIWACTTCGACMATCPVMIEHLPRLIDLRRHLVMEKAEFPAELINFFENIEQRFNPWGIAPADRTKWTEDLDVKILGDDVKAEYLFFVGCAGAFDTRSRQVTHSVSRILNRAGISWAILGTEEKCCGDSLRRLGNEYVFDKLVRDNIETFKKHGVKKIITQCPHCFSTLKNDYKQYGADFEVIHHSQLIDRLLKDGTIKLNGRADGRTVVHDSCYLGRYNNIYKQPREILKAASGGTAPLEMDRKGEESFCCGAGGGRMWMEEDIGKRIYLERTQEALKQNPSTIAVACPYCMTMFEDGLKDEKAEDKVAVKDLAEIVAEAMA